MEVLNISLVGPSPCVITGASEQGCRRLASCRRPGLCDGTSDLRLQCLCLTSVCSRAEGSELLQGRDPSAGGKVATQTPELKPTNAKIQ